MKAPLKIEAHEGKLMIVLPEEVVVGLQLQEGDEIDMEIRRTTREPIPHRQRLASLRKYRGRLPAGPKIDRGDAAGR